jgi:hypothetical protein
MEDAGGEDPLRLRGGKEGLLANLRLSPLTIAVGGEGSGEGGHLGSSGVARWPARTGPVPDMHVNYAAFVVRLLDPHVAADEIVRVRQHTPIAGFTSESGDGRIAA